MLSATPFLILAHDSVQDILPTTGHDCACADTNTRLLPVVTRAVGRQLIKPRLHTQRVDDEHYLAFNPLANSGPVVLNEAALGLLNGFSSFGREEFGASANSDSERSVAIHRLQELHLLEPSGTERHLARGETQTLIAWLHTTNACNLTCTYCYVDKSNEPMEEATGYAAVDAIFRSAVSNGFKAVKLKYAGGEATLNFGLVMKLHDYAAEKAQESGLDLKEVILSNGVALTRPMLDFLRDEKITLMISIDGIGEGHDVQRIFANGRGSSHIVKRSIDRALSHGVSPHISITVTANNADEVAAAVDFALERDLLFNLNFYRESDATMDGADLRAEDERLIEAMRQAFAVIEQNLPSHSLLASLIDRANFGSPHETVCGAGDSYLVVDQNGGISRCQMELERTVTDIFADDPLTEIRLHSGGFQNTSVEEKSGCRECDWRYWCAGGCPSLTYRATGRNDVKSPYCNVYKSLYPDLLQLEGLRILRQTSNGLVR